MGKGPIIMLCILCFPWKCNCPVYIEVTFPQFKPFNVSPFKLKTYMYSYTFRGAFITAFITYRYGALSCKIIWIWQLFSFKCVCMGLVKQLSHHIIVLGVVRLSLVVGHCFKHYSSILESCISTFGAKSRHVIFRGNIYCSIQSGESRGILLLLWVIYCHCMLHIL